MNEIPLIGLGTYSLTGQTCYEITKYALLNGYRLIDTAHMYNNESEIGKAIKDSNIPRKDLFIVSKVDSRFRSFELTYKGVKESLKNLNLDYIDLYLIHEPYNESLEMWEALIKLKNEGFVKEIGISNFFGKRYDNFMKNCKTKPFVNQLECHIFNQQKNMQEKLFKDSVRLMSWSVFTGGIKDFNDILILKEMSKKYNATIPQIILAFFMSQNIIVIPRSKNKTRIIENLNSKNIILDEIDIKKIKQLDEDKTLFSWTNCFK